MSRLTLSQNDDVLESSFLKTLSALLEVVLKSNTTTPHTFDFTTTTIHFLVARVRAYNRGLRGTAEDSALKTICKKLAQVKSIRITSRRSGTAAVLLSPSSPAASPASSKNSEGGITQNNTSFSSTSFPLVDAVTIDVSIFPNLEKLCLRDCVVGAVKGTTPVTVLELERSALLPPAVLESGGVLSTWNSFPSLTELLFLSCSQQTPHLPRCMDYLSHNSPKLRRLVLRDVFHGITAAELSRFTLFLGDSEASSTNTSLRWPSLRVLDLSSNRLLALDSSVSLLLNLEEVNLQNNDLYDLSPLIASRKLVVVRLAWNTSIGAGIGPSGMVEPWLPESYFPQVTSLDLSNCALAAIPPGIQNLVHLEHIGLKCNDLSSWLEVEDLIASCDQLTSIELAENHALLRPSWKKETYTDILCCLFGPKRGKIMIDGLGPYRAGAKNAKHEKKIRAILDAHLKMLDEEPTSCGAMSLPRSRSGSEPGTPKRAPAKVVTAVIEEETTTPVVGGGGSAFPGLESYRSSGILTPPAEALQNPEDNTNAHDASFSLMKRAYGDDWLSVAHNTTPLSPSLHSPTTMSKGGTIHDAGFDSPPHSTSSSHSRKVVRRVKTMTRTTAVVHRNVNMSLVRPPPLELLSQSLAKDTIQDLPSSPVLNSPADVPRTASPHTSKPSLSINITSPTIRTNTRGKGMSPRNSNKHVQQQQQQHSDNEITAEELEALTSVSLVHFVFALDQTGVAKIAKDEQTGVPTISFREDENNNNNSFGGRSSVVFTLESFQCGAMEYIVLRGPERIHSTVVISAEKKTATSSNIRFRNVNFYDAKTDGGNVQPVDTNGMDGFCSLPNEHRQYLAESYNNDCTNKKLWAKFIIPTNNNEEQQQQSFVDAFLRRFKQAMHHTNGFYLGHSASHQTATSNNNNNSNMMNLSPRSCMVGFDFLVESDELTKTTALCDFRQSFPLEETLDVYMVDDSHPITSNPVSSDEVSFHFQRYIFQSKHRDDTVMAKTCAAFNVPWCEPVIPPYLKPSGERERVDWHVVTNVLFLDSSGTKVCVEYSCVIACTNSYLYVALDFNDAAFEPLAVNQTYFLPVRCCARMSLSGLALDASHDSLTLTFDNGKGISTAFVAMTRDPKITLRLLGHLYDVIRSDDHVQVSLTQEKAPSQHKTYHVFLTLKTKARSGLQRLSNLLKPNGSRRGAQNVRPIWYHPTHHPLYPSRFSWSVNHLWIDDDVEVLDKRVHKDVSRVLSSPPYVAVQFADDSAWVMLCANISRANELVHDLSQSLSSGVDIIHVPEAEFFIQTFYLIPMDLVMGGLSGSRRQRTVQQLLSSTVLGPYRTTLQHV